MYDFSDSCLAVLIRSGGGTKKFKVGIKVRATLGDVNPSPPTPEKLKVESGFGVTLGDVFLCFSEK